MLVWLVQGPHVDKHWPREQHLHLGNTRQSGPALPVSLVLFPFTLPTDILTIYLYFAADIMLFPVAVISHAYC